MLYIMSLYLPVSLSGSNLGERHQHLNSLVDRAYKDNIRIENIIALPEESPIDRIFKIDLASKYRHVDYILQNLKDDSMLYVSRSLKCLWLLDSQYRDIINPSYLEEHIYPAMIQPAVNKMKHWFKLNLRDAERCQKFYNYYKSNFDDAFGFIWHCSIEFILSEFPNIVDKFSLKQLKILFDACPAACKLYFEILPNNKSALSQYVRNYREYFKTTKCLLKWDANEYLNIVEKYYDTTKYYPFGPSATQYLLKNYKTRVFAKIELYVSSLLHMDTLAATLCSDEAKQLIYLLARAEYLSSWFSYKKVEPLIKRVKTDERAQLKKQVFVEKALDSKVAKWPYDIPTPLKLEEEEENRLLWDAGHAGTYMMQNSFRCGMMKRKLCKRSGKWDCRIVSVKSPLDKLFEHYRFAGFERTFNELRKKLLTESTIQGRLNIMLVLVSKSGGVNEQVEKLLTLLVEKHKNESTILRAAVIRSLVNRGSAWRLQDKPWNLVLEFGRDLGLDGANTDPLCKEGLHAVVIRHLLTNTALPQDVLSGFLTNHSLLIEYKLSTNEKAIIEKRLPLLFLPSNPNAFLDALLEYKVSINEFPDAVPILVKLAQEDNDLVDRLYKANVLRRELFSKIFELQQTEAAYINVLRHDISPLQQGKFFALLVQEKERVIYDRFLQSLKLYFGEPGGLAETHHTFLEKALAEKPKSQFARPLCILSSGQIILARDDINESTQNKDKDKIKLRISAAFRANFHKTIPPLNIDELNWRWLGAKAVAIKVLICREKDREMYLTKLLEWQGTAKISLRLSFGTPFAVESFIQVCSLRPIAALKVAASSYLKQKDIDIRIWEAVKSIIENITEKAENTKGIKKKHRFLGKLAYPESIPKLIEADYRVVMFNLYSKFDDDKALFQLGEIQKLLQEVDKVFLDKLAKEFVEKNLSLDYWKEDYNFSEEVYIRIICNSLLLADTESRQNYVLDNNCDKFFNAMEVLFQNKSDEDRKVVEYLNKFIVSLKYTKAFLGQQYVNPYPVFERVLKRLRKILPTREYFKQYAEIHLTMLYYKTLQQASKLQSDIFIDTKKTKECIEIVGRIFGKYIGFEIKELVSRYFRSIIDLYKEIVDKYIDYYFVGSKSKNMFVTFVIKGLLEIKSTEAALVAEHLVIKNPRCIIESRMDILKNFEELDDTEVNLYIHSQILSNIAYVKAPPICYT